MHHHDDWDAPPKGGTLKTVLRNVLLIVLASSGAAWALSYRSDVSDSLQAWLPRAEAPALDTRQGGLPDPDREAHDEGQAEVAEDDAGLSDEHMKASDEAQEEESAADADYDREIVVRRARNGHFFLEAMVNGVPITFLIDTGASDVMLTPKDARRLRLNDATLDYSLRYETANGAVHAAPVTLRELRIGQLEMYDVDAAVNGAAMNVSLLGMSFLERLSGYSVEGSRLVLQW